MEGKLKEIVTFLEGNFAEKKEIGRKPYVPKVEALYQSILTSLSNTVLSSFDSVIPMTAALEFLAM